jgi:hypothetical protein
VTWVLVDRKLAQNSIAGRQNRTSRAHILRGLVLNQLNVGNLNAKLKKRTKNTFSEELDKRALVIGAPKPNQRHMVKKKVSGASHADGAHERAAARVDFVVRANRTDTNVRRAERYPKQFRLDPPITQGMSLISLARALDAPAPPLYDPVRKDELELAMQQQLQANRDAFQNYCKQRISDIAQDVGLDAKSKVRATVKELELQAKHGNLFKRYLTLTSDKCARCDQDVCETTKHLMCDYPASAPFLDELVSTVAAAAPQRSFSRLFCKEEKDRQDYPGDRVAAYWLLLGYKPRRLKSAYAKVPALPAIIRKAKTVAKRSILDQKRHADTVAYYHYSRAIDARVMGLGDPPPVPPPALPGEEGAQAQDDDVQEALLVLVAMRHNGLPPPTHH